MIAEYYMKEKQLEEEVRVLKVQVSQLCLTKEQVMESSCNRLLVDQLTNLEKKVAELRVKLMFLCRMR